MLVMMAIVVGVTNLLIIRTTGTAATTTTITITSGPWMIIPNTVIRKFAKVKDVVSSQLLSINNKNSSYHHPMKGFLHKQQQFKLDSHIRRQRVIIDDSDMGEPSTTKFNTSLTTGTTTNVSVDIESSSPSGCSSSFSSSSEEVISSQSWIDRTINQMIIIVSYFAIGQTIIHLFNSHRSEITTELTTKLFSPESIKVIQTIQSILRNVHTEHGVVDVFGKYRTIDVLTSIIAFSRLQRIVIPYERRKYIMEQHQQKQQRNYETVDVSLTKELVHYAKYAYAAYGWTFDLALRMKIHLGGNAQALIRFTGIHANDIVKMEWNTKPPHQPAYYIVRDHIYHTIVVCIRGTWSVNDMLTNLYCTSSTSNDDWYQQLFYPSREWTCHRGMFEAAKAVYNDAGSIIRNEMLHYPEYTLVLTGHSLGGGCAALLGKLLQNQYPTLKVYIFGAPCVVPERNSIISNNKNVVSVIAKGDPFSCLSLGHIADVSKAIEYLCKNDVLRNEVLQRTRNSSSNSSSGIMMNKNTNKNYDTDDDDESTNNLPWYIATMTLLRKHMNAEKLYPPGRILLLHHQQHHDHDNDHSQTRRTTWRWYYRWRQRRKKSNLVTLQDVPLHYFQDLVISPNMFNLSKHIPSMYISALNDIVTRTTSSKYDKQ